jgi:hypothetical protein
MVTSTPRTVMAGDPNVEACARASEEGQRASAARRFGDARTQLLLCTQSACPPAIRRDCDELLAQVEVEAPSVILVVRDAAAHDVGVADVTIDGAPAPRALAGGALALDPGPHTIRVARGRDVVEQSLVLREREKDRVVELRFAAPPGVSRSAVPWSVYPLAGLGLAGLAAFTGLAISGQSTYDACESHGCDDARRSSLEVERWLTWTSLGVGIASVAAGTAILVLRRRDDVSIEVGGSVAEMYLRGTF